MARLDPIFAALADPTRRQIVAQLAAGDATVSEIVRRFSLTQPTISAHLKVLEAAGLISRSKNGQTRPCRLAPEGLRAVDGWLAEYRQFWTGNLNRLQAYADQIATNDGSLNDDEQ